MRRLELPTTTEARQMTELRSRPGDIDLLITRPLPSPKVRSGRDGSTLVQSFDGVDSPRRPDVSG
jgi:hypothetical protein